VCVQKLVEITKDHILFHFLQLQVKNTSFRDNTNYTFKVISNEAVLSFVIIVDADVRVNSMKRK